MLLNIQASEFIYALFFTTFIFVAFKKGYGHSIVGTLICLYDGDDWDTNLIAPLVGGIVVPRLMSSFL
jgi:hypothetical protein